MLHGVILIVLAIKGLGLFRARCLDNGVGSVVGNSSSARKHPLECTEVDRGDLVVYLAFDGLFPLFHENFVKGPEVAAVLIDCIFNPVSKGAVRRVEPKPVYNQV